MVLPWPGLPPNSRRSPALSPPLSTSPRGWKPGAKGVGRGSRSAVSVRSASVSSADRAGVGPVAASRLVTSAPEGVGDPDGSGAEQHDEHGGQDAEDDGEED